MVRKSLFKRDFVEKLPWNYSGFVVVGAGLSRTGTTSMRAALGYLLAGACYHLLNHDSADEYDVAFWHKAMDGETTKQDWIEFFEGRGFRSAVDMPSNLFYKELIEAYPNLKVILMTRDPHKWYKSAKNVCDNVLTLRSDPALVLLTAFNGDRGRIKMALRGMDYALPGFETGLLTAVMTSEEKAIEFFNKWNDEVRRSVPKDRLLEFRVQDGWKPLCDFLNMPVPDIPFPHLNDTSSSNAMFRRGRMVAYTFVYALPILVAALVWYLFL